jgi:hypothetical protein
LVLSLEKEESPHASWLPELGIACAPHGAPLPLAVWLLLKSRMSTVVKLCRELEENEPEKARREEKRKAGAMVPGGVGIARSLDSRHRLCLFRSQKAPVAGRCGFGLWEDSYIFSLCSCLT